jgi:short-subunit dehydrogenase
MRSFTDRVAVVTGAASGIGRHTAIELAKRGCHVAISDVNMAGLEETAELVRAHNRNVSLHLVDVGDRQTMSDFADAVIAEHGAVHIIVNNAGVSLTVKFEEQTLDDLEWIVNINLWGVIYGCHFFLPHIRKADEGHIVNISSLFGLIGVPRQSAYCLCKAAVRGFTESLDMELADTDIGVSCIHPGAVATGIVRNGRTMNGFDVEEASKLIDKGMHPAGAANIIVDAIASGKKRVIVGRDAKIIETLQRMFPTWYRNLVVRISKRAEDKIRAKSGHA